MKQTQQHNNKAQNKVNISFANEWSKTNGFFIFVLQISGTLCVYVYVCICLCFFRFFNPPSNSAASSKHTVVCGIAVVALIL